MEIHQKALDWNISYCSTLDYKIPPWKILKNTRALCACPIPFQEIPITCNRQQPLYETSTWPGRKGDDAQAFYNLMANVTSNEQGNFKEFALLLSQKQILKNFLSIGQYYDVKKGYD